MREWIIQAETIGNISDGYWYSNGEEIVRCKDCIYFREYLCDRLKYSHVTNADSFCSEGEREADDL